MKEDTFGSTTTTGAMTINSATWNDTVNFYSSTGGIAINGAQNYGANNVRFLIGNSDVSIGAALTGTGDLYINPGNTTSMGIGTGQPGVLSLSDTELDFLTDGWRSINLGNVFSATPTNIGAYTWRDPIVFQSNSAITVNGAQTMGSNNLIFALDNDLILNAGLTGTGNLSIYRGSLTNTTIGIGGGAGTVNLSTGDLVNITDGWSSIVIGNSDGTGAITANAATWNDDLTLQTNTGVITVAGEQTMGANNLNIISNGNPLINAALTGSGSLTLRSATTIGLGGGAGIFNLSSAKLANITDGWSNIIIGGTTGTTGAITANALSWNDNLILQSNTGAITIAGAQTMGANNLTITSNNDPAINAALNGTGILTFQGGTNGTTIGVGGGGGTLGLTTAEINNIADGWSTIIIGSTAGDGAMDVQAHTWLDSVVFRSNNGVITVNGTQTMGTNNLSFLTRSNLALNSGISGSGTLTIAPIANATTIGVAGGAGSLNIGTADLANIIDGWGNIIIGNPTGTALMTVGAATWNDPLTLRSGNIILVSGAQTMGANDLTILTDGNPSFTAPLTGSGTLTIAGILDATTIGIGGGAGSVFLSTSDLGFISDGWGNIVIGSATGTGAITANASTWNDNLTLQSDIGVMTINGAQAMGANNLIFSTNANPVINAGLSGTGRLTFQGFANTTTLGLGGAAGTLNLSDAELDFITDGWNELVFGKAAGTGEVTLNAYNNWRDSVVLRKDTSNLSSSVVVGGVQEVASASDASFTFDANTRLAASLLTHGGNIDFLDTVSIETDISLDAGSGDIGFNNLVDGSYDLNLLTTGDVMFISDVGSISRLGDVTATGLHDFLSAGQVNVSSFALAGGTGSATFNSTGIDAMGDIDITSEGIYGVLSGAGGFLNSGFGDIAATVTFDTLDISGATATLLAGNIGPIAAADQTMANLISVNGVLLPMQSTAYTFAGFLIGLPDSTIDFPSQLTQADIIRILTQPQRTYGLNSVVLVKPQEHDIFMPSPIDYGYEWIYIIDQLIGISPELAEKLKKTV